MEGERGAYPFIVNRSEKFISEERNGVCFTRIPGRFSVCDSVNGNNRRYPKKVWEKNLNDGSMLKLSIQKNGAFGLLEHPADGKISLQSPICILVTDAKLQTGNDSASKQRVDEVVGEIIVLNTAEGQKLRALIEVGYNPLVSSRGFGSVVKASDGVDEVQEDYVCEGWDVVLKPSFEHAELFVNRENKTEAEVASPTRKLKGVMAENRVMAEARRKVPYSAGGKDYVWPDSGPDTMYPGAEGAWQSDHSDPRNVAMRKASAQYSAQPDVNVSPKALENYHQAYIKYCTEQGSSSQDAESEWQAGLAELLADADLVDELEKNYGEQSTAPTDSTPLPRTESPPAATAVAAPVAASIPTKTTESKNMTINEIKSRIGAIKGTQVPKEPARFAEGLSELATIHQEIANTVAEDAKRGWQGQQLHEEVTRIERAWSESVLAPSKAAVKLSENYTKVLKVTKVIGEAAIGFRKKLSEAMAHNAEAAQLVEELTERGQAWVAIADKRKEQSASLNHKLEVACEALDIIKTRYHEDMTEMGRHVITLEFAEKAQAPDIQKLLKEAKSPKDIIAIREKLDPEGAKARKAAPRTESAAPAAPSVQEGKTASAPAEMGSRVLVPSVRSISESVAMVQRLSSTEKPKEEPARK